MYTREEQSAEMAASDGETTAVGIADSRNTYFRTAHLTEEVRRRSIRGGIVTLIAQGGKFSLNILSVAILGRLLTPSDYGLVGMAGIFTIFLSIMTEGGLTTATIQQQDIDHAKASNVFWLNLLLGLLATLVLAGSAPLLGKYFRDNRVTSIALVLSGTFFLQAWGMQHNAILQRQMRFTAINAISLFSIGMSLVFSVTAAFLGASYWALVIQQYALALFSVIGVWVACGWRPGRYRRETCVQTAIKFGGYLTGFRLANAIAKSFDAFLIGRFLGTVHLGYYNRAYTIFVYPMGQVLTPVTSVGIPALSRLAGERERFHRAFFTMYIMLAAFTLPCMAFVMATAPTIVRVVLGEQWGETGAVLRWLAPIALYSAIVTACGWLFTARGNSRQLCYWGVLNAVLVLIGFIVSVPYGLVAVAAVYALGGILVRAPSLIFWASRCFDIPQVAFYRSLFSHIACSAIVAVVATASTQMLASYPAWCNLLGTGIVSITAYTGAVMASASGRTFMHEAKGLACSLRNTRSYGG